MLCLFFIRNYKSYKNKILNHIFLERYVASPLGGAVTSTELIRRSCKFCPATFNFKLLKKKKELNK